MGDLAKGDVGKAGGNRLRWGEGKRLEQGFLSGASRAGLNQGGGRREDGDRTQRPPGACTRQVPLLRKNMVLGQEEGVH